MLKHMSLLEQISSFDNLYMAFKECSKGKKSKIGYQNFIFNHGEKLKEIENEISSTGTYKWGPYREFEVCDPKKRTIMAAPFKDRVVHTAIHRILNPIVDKSFGIRTYACRSNMGNRSAVQRLWRHLKYVREKRYTIKLDVKQYFSHVNHKILLNQLMNILDDGSVYPLLTDLIESNSKYKLLGRGIPIGNLTSQLFANLYLSSLDQLACNTLGISSLIDRDEDCFYIRYMDDMVIIGRSKEQALDCAKNLVSFAEVSLNLSIPSYKFVMLSNDDVPFLGFVLSTDEYRVLARNKRKIIKKIKRLVKNNGSLSDRAVIIQSYSAWKVLDENTMNSDFKKE